MGHRCNIIKGVSDELESGIENQIVELVLDESTDTSLFPISILSGWFK